SEDVEPTLVVLARSASPAKIEASAAKGIGGQTMPDMRWGRGDSKTVMLLPLARAKQAAHKEGAKEAWLVDAKGYVTEGASSNAWILDGQGGLITRQIANALLRGVPRPTMTD